MEAIHKELVKKALPFITSYQDDLLKHDKRELETYPDRKFLHFTGSTGTHIVTLYWKEDYSNKGERVPYLFGFADRYHILKEISSVLQALTGCNRMDLILYFNGTTLKAIDYEKAKEIISDYTYTMQNNFAA